jgi:hypothetical protein
MKTPIILFEIKMEIDIDIITSLASFIVSLFVAIYLYILEKRRDEYQIKQTGEFNKWMKKQAQRLSAMMEALQKGLPKPQAEELTKRMAEFTPGSVQVGDVILRRDNIRIAQTFLGGGTYVEATAFDEEGERLSSELEKLKGKSVKFISPDHTGMAQVKEITVEKTKGEGGFLYVFHISLQIKA